MSPGSSKKSSDSPLSMARNFPDYVHALKLTPEEEKLFKTLESNFKNGTSFQDSFKCGFEGRGLEIFKSIFVRDYHDLLLARKLMDEGIIEGCQVVAFVQDNFDIDTQKEILSPSVHQVFQNFYRENCDNGWGNRPLGSYMLAHWAMTKKWKEDGGEAVPPSQPQRQPVLAN